MFIVTFLFSVYIKLTLTFLVKCLSLIRLSIETSPWNEYFINDKLSVLF